MPKIRSSADLRNNYNEISTFCHDYAEPVFITKNGKGDLAVMSIETYEALTARFDLYAKLQEGLDDVAAGRTRPLDEFMQELQNRRSLRLNYVIDVAASAQRDLAACLRLYRPDLENPSAADKLVAIAWKKFRSLDTFPQRFSLVNDPFLSSLGIRLIPVQNYLAFYKVDSSTQTVHILRFLYGHSDWQAILRADVLPT